MFSPIASFHVTIPTALLSRRFKREETIRYRVSSDIENQGGKVHYDYRFEVELKKDTLDKKIRLLVGKISNLVVSVNDQNETIHSAGVVPFALTTNGPPINLTSGGPFSTYTIPILGLCLPDEAPRWDCTFDIKPFAVHGLNRIAGTGRVTSLRSRRLEIQLKFSFEDGKFAGTAEMLSQFEFGTNVWLGAEGSFTSATETCHFKVYR
jgi:hypothetical protein